ncbi:GntR family transcriptional regulator [bacterium]|nr:GntR family transcriptional regulator [bacterium]MCI0602591.1 GntR family transcriptional regulator [bacterium]
MKLWLSKSSKVPLHEQLTTQLVLGIVSADLAPGEHLPSTNQLARRFQIHPNTVRAAYRHLVKTGWLEWRRGSGFYVCDFKKDAKVSPGLELDHLISTFFRLARDKGYSLEEIQTRIVRWFSVQPPDHILVIEPEPELREILTIEIGKQNIKRVDGISLEECSKPEKFLGAFCVALYDSAKAVKAVLPAGISCLFLHSRSISKNLQNQIKPGPDTLITVVSRWPSFLTWSHTTLVAVGIDSESILLRDARNKSWERGLTPRDFIITDSLLAGRFPKNFKPHVFPIISDESLQELRTQFQT